MSNTVKGFKVTNSDMKCRDFQFELNKEFTHDGDIKLCGAGFHFCLIANNCFNYYDFNPANRVFEIEASGNVEHGDDKSVASTIKFIREISWEEVLTIVNLGKANTGRGNSGDRNSGDRNSGNWNSGDRNSGDSNSGYRNSGAFCTESNPKLWLFDKPTDILIKDWEESDAVRLMYSIDTTIWVNAGVMTDKEKSEYPYWETTEGYLKTIPIKEAWSNAWHNWSEENRAVFTSLPNFDAKKFEEITGIKASKRKSKK